MPRQERFMSASSSEYGDQPQALLEARNRLAELGTKQAETADTHVVVRQIWVGDEVNVEGSAVRRRQITDIHRLEIHEQRQRCHPGPDDRQEQTFDERDARRWIRL